MSLSDADIRGLIGLYDVATSKIQRHSKNLTLERCKEGIIGEYPFPDFPKIWGGFDKYTQDSEGAGIYSWILTNPSSKLVWGVARVPEKSKIELRGDKFSGKDFKERLLHINQLEEKLIVSSSRLRFFMEVKPFDSHPDNFNSRGYGFWFEQEDKKRNMGLFEGTEDKLKNVLGPGNFVCPVSIIERIEVFVQFAERFMFE